MASQSTLLECPMCAFSVLPSDEYFLQLHFEQQHTTDSPFRVEGDTLSPLPPLPARPSLEHKHDDEETPSDFDHENNVLCPEPDCGETVLLTELNDHLELHAASTLSFDEATGEYHQQATGNIAGLMSTTTTGKMTPSLPDDSSTEAPDGLRKHRRNARKLKKRGRGDSSGSEKSTLSRSIQWFHPAALAKGNKIVKPPRSNVRLGRAELGPHAWEDRMPKWLHRQLEEGPKISVVNRIGRDGRLIKQETVQNETPGVIPILAQLSAVDRSVKEAYYCHPSTLHIYKTPKEGGFCGYRNIQMLVSYIQGAHAQGLDEFPGRTPGILKLQDMIERAWDKGINEIGRQQTGGIRDTRKYIGTPEAQALFLSCQIDCAVDMFTDSPDGQIEAHQQLFIAVERYFAQAAIKDGSHVYKTLLPPIYLQQPGHSLTIVGFERRRDGNCNLMTFDPMHGTSPAMHRLIGRKHIRTPLPEVLHAYRRGRRQLRKHAAFEVLMLTAHPPLFPAWDVLRQFPDCRFLYVFFRARTLGYDVYPEDHFLRNFPWQQYGGLWIVDDARFACEEKINPLAAQALRRITSAGSSAQSASSMGCSMGTGCHSHHGMQIPSNLLNNRSAPSTRHVSHASGFDGAHTFGEANMPDADAYFGPVLDQIVMQPTQAHLKRPALSIQTSLEKRFPGYPTPLSPTTDAKAWFPTPCSETGSGIGMIRTGSPMSIDASSMYDQSHRCLSHKHEHYDNVHPCSNPGYTGKPATSIPSRCTSANSNLKFIQRQDQVLPPIRAPITTVGAPPTPPTSPPHSSSPRTAMLRNVYDKLATQIVSGRMPACPKQPQIPHLRGAASNQSTSNTPKPTIDIANGTESLIVSPISSSETILSYRSNRSADSGLLGVQPLSENQVAEYRFWRPCGRRSCAFGCGGADEGEIAAARRLFRGEEIVTEEAEKGD